MRMYDIIKSKRDGFELSEAEINFFVDGFTNGSIPDYQVSALMMAVYFNSMNEKETSFLTKAMVNSGDIIDLSEIHGIKVDKHSTGGVGDKTTLIVMPIVACNGVKMAKMSGKGLGHTGGTIDKLESIPGFNTSLSKEDFLGNVNVHNACIIGQSMNLAPADKKIYALRDVTATVDIIPLIASSIMSKKIAAGCDCIVLDVKCGNGAFMKTLDDAKLLAREMIQIGENAGKKTVAFITDMDIPLGKNIGNSLEVIEAIEVLNNRGDKMLTELCLHLSAALLNLADKGSYDECYELSVKSLESGLALKKFAEIVASQGGNANYIFNPELFEKAQYSGKILASQNGYLVNIDAEKTGNASVLAGAGRLKKDDIIDYSAGIVLKKKYADYAEKGEEIAVVYGNNEEKLLSAVSLLDTAFTFTTTQPENKKVILDKISKETK